MNAVDINCITI